MSLIDFILNIVGLLLWLNWRAAAFPVQRAPGAALLPNIRAAGPPGPRYFQWASIPILLVARAVFYRIAGQPVHWNPLMPLGPTTLSFRSDLLGRMLVFSFLSFGATLWFCYLGLLFVSSVNGRAADGDPLQRMIRSWLGRLDRWPAPVKMLLPLAIAVIAWVALHPMLVWLRMAPANTFGHLVVQGVLIGLSAYLSLKFLVAALFILYLLTSYVYLGEFVLWKFVNLTCRRLLGPLQNLPLRAGRIDLAPFLYVTAVWLVAEGVQRGLNRFYHYFL